MRPCRHSAHEECAARLGFRRDIPRSFCWASLAGEDVSGGRKKQQRVPGMSFRRPVRPAGTPVSFMIMVIVGLSGRVDALIITLRSASDADVDYAVDAWTAASHSKVLDGLIGDLGDRVGRVQVPNIASSELQLIVEFMNATAVEEVLSHSQFCARIPLMDDPGL